MWVAPVIAASVFGYLSLERPAGLAAAAPVLLLWFAAPVITWYISRPLARRDERLTADQLRFLRGVARRTWRFFETCVGPGDHWLPPDNFQESPAPGLAHRTSPTNMGLALLANLSAYDFGYISAGRLVSRTLNAFEAMSAMERHRGHFYNWYDTRSLAPLEPRYISSVDSGNLAGHLLTLRPGLLALPDAPILPPQTFHGLRNTLELMAGAGPVAQPAAMARLQKALDEACDSPPSTVAAGRLILERLGAESRALAAAPATASDGHEARGWAAALAAQCADICDDLASLAPWTSVGASAAPHVHLPGFTAIPTLTELAALDGEWGAPARARIASINRLAAQTVDFAEMELEFLFDRTRHLLSIGYNVAERRRDASFYDLLASEARLASFVAIAQGHLPQESWFALGRLLTTAAGEPVLLSWSGSMFEYLMPLLVMPSYDGTLLDQTCKAAVKRQIEYGRHRGVPWGISECGYNLLDSRLAYQYRAFGVPGLGLKRGLADDLVVAPYASALALMVSPGEACANLQRLAAEGFGGDLRLLRGDRLHAGAPAPGPPERHRPFLHGAPPGDECSCRWRRCCSTADAGAIRLRPGVPGDGAAAAGADPARGRVLPARRRPPRTPERRRRPPTSRCARSAGPTRPPPKCSCSPTAAITSWSRTRAAGTAAGRTWPSPAGARTRRRDNWGTFCYLRDVASGAFWSTAHQPTLQPAERLRGDLLRGPRRVPPQRRARSKRTPKSPCRRKTTSSCGGCASPTAAARAGRSR